VIAGTWVVVVVVVMVVVVVVYLLAMGFDYWRKGTVLGASLLVGALGPAGVDVAEYERLRSRLTETQSQTRYLQSMVSIRDQELDRARKVRNLHISFG